jgi:hypothetical protein
MCGRKRKPGKRESNGRIKRPAAASRDVRDVVLAQPHRRGFDRNDPYAESPLGRFVLKHKLDRLCYDSALTYGRLAGKVFSSRDATRPILGTRSSVGSGKEMSTAVARHLQRELEQVDKQLGKNEIRALRTLALFELEELPEDSEAAVAAFAGVDLRAGYRYG